MERFLRMYQNLSADNLQTLRSAYRNDVRFIDPAHEINGIENLTAYFSALYKNINSIHFSFGEPMVADNSGYVSWEVTFSLICPGFIKTPLTDLNEFPMPFRINVQQASDYIRKRLLKRKAEIHFPKRFTFILKLLSLLPGPLWTIIGRQMVRR